MKGSFDMKTVSPFAGLITQEHIDKALKVVRKVAAKGKTPDARRKALNVLKAWERRTGQKVTGGLLLKPRRKTTKN